MGKDEADMTKNYIYFRSPIGKALIGKSKKDLVFLQQKNLTQRILEEIKKWSVEKQRKFYFEVLCEEYGEISIKNKYKKAGVPMP